MKRMYFLTKLFIIFNFLIIMLGTGEVCSSTYLGITANHQLFDFNFSSNLKDEPKDKQKSGINCDRFGAEIFLGSGIFFDDFYAGVEAFVSECDIKGRSTFFHENAYINGYNFLAVKVRKKHSYGLAFRPGYKLSEKILLFAKAGFVRNKLGLNVTNLNEPLCEKNFSYRFSKTITSPLIGAGIDMKMMDNITGRLEFSYTATKVKKIDFDQMFDISFKLKSSEIKAGIIISL